MAEGGSGSDGGSGSVGGRVREFERQLLVEIARHIIRRDRRDGQWSPVGDALDRLYRAMADQQAEDLATEQERCGA